MNDDALVITIEKQKEPSVYTGYWKFCFERPNGDFAYGEGFCSEIDALNFAVKLVKGELA